MYDPIDTFLLYAPGTVDVNLVLFMPSAMQTIKVLAVAGRICVTHDLMIDPFPKVMVSGKNH